MEIPDRIERQLDGETIQSTVSLGDEDVICFTPTRTFLYRGEGLLSDESLDIYDNDVERLNISKGRRKTTFSLEYVDYVENFKIPNNRSEQVIQRLLAGVLSTGGVIADEESVAGVFLFSELTIIVTDARVVKHIGSYVWDPDYEEFPFDSVTALGFEEGSVATQIVLTVDGRPQRIKAPSDKAAKLRRTLTEVLFTYYDVQSLEELNEMIAEEEDSSAGAEDTGDEFGLDDSISPLVSSDDEEPDSSATASGAGEEATQTVVSTAIDEQESEKAASDTGESEAGTGKGNQLATPSETEASAQPAIDQEAFEDLQSQLAELTAAVEAQEAKIDKQNEELENQRETIQQLIEELRQQV